MTYAVSDRNGGTATSTYTPTVRGQAVEDVGALSNGQLGAMDDPVTVDVVSQVLGLVPSSVRLVDPSGRSVLSLTVAGQGVWTVDTTTCTVTFTPAAGFTGDPDPVGLRGITSGGTPVVGEVAARYASPSGGEGGGLADTGAPVLDRQTGAGLALLLLGAALTVLARRRRT